MSIEMEVEVPENQENVSQRYYDTIIDCFRKLTKGNENVYNKNALKLLKHVHFSSKLDNQVEVQYVFNRLIRGLGSTTRESYYPILVALLDTVPEVHIENVIKSIEKELQIAGNSSKSDKNDVYLGQILCGGSVLRSKLFLKLSKEHRKYVLELILNTRNNKRNLSCVASAFIIDFINTIDKEQFFAIVWPTYRSLINKTWEEQNIDDVYLAMAIQTKFPETIKTPEMTTSFGKHGILTKGNIQSICNVLFKLSDVKALKHPAYGAIAKLIGQSKLLPTFLTCLDAQLLKFNRNKLFIASIILRNIISNIKDSQEMPNLLTNNFVRKLIEHHENKKWKSDQELTAEIKNVFKTLIDSLAKEEISSHVKMSVIKRLIFYPGTLTFETITETRVLQNLVPTLDLQEVKSLSELFKDIILGRSQAATEDTKRPWSNAERTYALQILVKLLSHSKVKDDVSFRAEYMKMFMDLGFLENKETVFISDLAKEWFFKVLENKFSKLIDLHSFLSQLNEHLKSLIKLDNLKVSFTEEELKTLKKMFKLTTKQKANDAAVQVFHFLFSYMGLQTFKNKDLAFNCLNELFLCYERVDGKRTSKSKNDDDPEWIEVVVDLFLSLLSLNLNLFRNFIASIFPGLCEYLTPTAIEQILNVMDPTSGDNPLSNVDDEDDESEVSENEDEESDAEAEKDDSDSEEDESDEDNSELEDSVTDLDKLRLAVQQALQSDEVDDTDSGDLDLDCMSETEGKRLDDALSNAFKEFRSSKPRKRNESDRILINLRLKVMDLIEVIVNQDPSMSTCLKIMKVLLNTLEFTTLKEDQEPLQTRIRNFLKRLKAIKKFSNIEEVTLEELGSLFRDIVDKGEKSMATYQQLNQDRAHCCVFIIKCSQILCKEEDISSPTKVTDNSVIHALHEITKGCLENRSTISFNILLKTVDIPWNGNLFIIKLLLNSYHEVKVVKQRLILDVLKKFYINRRVEYGHEEFKLHLEKAEKKFVKELKKSIGQFSASETKEGGIAKNDIAVKLLHLIKSMGLHPFKNQIINWKELLETLQEYSSLLSPHVQTLCNGLCRNLNVAVSTKKLQKQSKKAKKSKLQVSVNDNSSKTVNESVNDSESEEKDVEETQEETVEETEEEKVDEAEEELVDTSISRKKKGLNKRKINTKEDNDAIASNTKSEKKRSKKQKMKTENSFNLSSTENVKDAETNSKKRKKKPQNKNKNAKKSKIQ